MHEDPAIRVISRAQLRANADGEMAASLISQKAVSHLKEKREQRRKRLGGNNPPRFRKERKEEIAKEKW